MVELGCGTGRFAAGLLARHLPDDATYLGVDVSPRMVAATGERLRPWSDRAAVVLVDGGGAVPATDGSADRFVANYVFDLLSPEGTGAALAEARRVLVPGGLLCATGLTPADGGGRVVIIREQGPLVGAQTWNVTSGGSAADTARRIDADNSYQLRRLARGGVGAR